MAERIKMGVGQGSGDEVEGEVEVRLVKSVSMVLRSKINAHIPKRTM